MSYCASDRIDGAGRLTRPAPHDATPTIISPSLAAQISYYFGSMPGNVSTVMVHRAVLDRVGLFRSMRQAGDFELWTRISGKYPIGFIRESLVEVRVHPKQFSLWAGEGVASMREQKAILRTLFERLPPDLRSYATMYNRRTRHVYFMNYFLRSVLQGDFRTAKGAFGELADMNHFFSLFLLWLVTANGRWFHPKPIYRP